jgi:restriction system protein
MAKRNESILELLAVLPWWACVGLSGLSFLVLRYFIPSMRLQQHGPLDLSYTFIKGITGAAYSFAPIIALLLLIPALISFIKAKRKFRSSSRTAVRTFSQGSPSRPPVAPISEEELHKRWLMGVSRTPTQSPQPFIQNPQLACPKNGQLEARGEEVSLSAKTLSQMEWYSFELICKIYYESIGYRVTKTKAGADGGIDLLLYSDGSESPHAAVQCKTRASWKVGIKHVRELLGAMTAEQVGNGILVTNSSFTKEAADFAKAQSIELIDLKGLAFLIGQLDEEKKERLTQFLESTDFETPTCPNCEVKLIERVAKKGKDAGQVFWGCQNYPKCRYTLNESRT